MKHKRIVIAGYAGIGKTTLAKKYSNVIDLESSSFKYYEEKHHNFSEQVKGSKNRMLNKEYPYNFFAALEGAILNYNFVLIARYPVFLDYLELRNIDYWMVYPDKNSLSEYKKRFIKRGNTKEYIEKVIINYDQELEALKKYKGHRVILKGNETLESYLLKSGYKLDKK